MPSDGVRLISVDSGSSATNVKKSTQFCVQLFCINAGNNTAKKGRTNNSGSPLVSETVPAIKNTIAQVMYFMRKLNAILLLTTFKN
jgi:hypothetical protein